MKDKKDKIYYFQEKSNDILDLQDELTVEEIGIYFILKAGYFKYAGDLKKENANQRCKFFGDINKFNLMISKLFDQVDGLLINKSWLSEVKNIKALSEKRKEIAESRWKTQQVKKEDKPNNNPKKPKANPEKPKETQSVFSEPITDKDNEEKYFYDKLPDFIDKKMWTDFIDFRISIATKLKPLTNKVKNLLIKKLSDFEKVGKGNANLALENSIVNSWQGVFEPKQNNFNNNKKPVGMPQPQYNDPDYYKNDGGWND